jgi:hypothetical protein
MSRSASAKAGGRVESRLLRSILTPRYLFNIESIIEYRLLFSLVAETGGKEIIQKEGKREGKEDRWIV